jgi:hypothetical protein
MDWPVMVDSLDLLGVSAVPITLFLDEQGIVRRIRPKTEELEPFLKEAPPAGDNLTPAQAVAPNLSNLKKRVDTGGSEHLREYANSLFLWGGASNLDHAVRAFEELVIRSPEDGAARFGLGVALRHRYDSGSKDPADFYRAVEAWSDALEIDPNQYIWRRRIQQYGPRLDKPYSFYDWVSTARREIAARGETPLQLTVEPGGAELAYPAKELSSSLSDSVEPDPSNRILKDKQGLINSRAVVVPNTSDGNLSARVHVLFTPNPKKKAHWNNEAGDMKVWISPSAGIEVDRKLAVLEVPPQEVSQETRRAEFELRSETQLDRADKLSGYALYYVCEDVNGTCLYRRLDFDIEF